MDRRSLDGLADVIGAQGGSKALVVTDKGIRGAGLLDHVITPLRQAQLPIEVFDDVTGNPDVAGVDAAYDMLQGCGADTIVAVGGGSSIDTAKAVSILATNGGAISDYEGVEQFTVPPLPLIAVPTTVGSGSEVTKGAVITNPVTKVKMVIVSNLLYPTAAFLDERMVATLPPALVAGTGGDALAHAVEAYVAKGANPFTDALNLAAIKLIGRFLRPATAGNPDARFQMLIASCLAGAGFHNAGLGLVHALANTAGAHFGIHHGTANTILLPPVMAFNMIAAPERFAEIADALGERVDGLSTIAAARRAVAAIEEMFTEVGAPRRLRDVGVTEDAIPVMARDALAQADRPGNPRTNQLEDLEALYRQAF
jgi:alcohol dehydrogenase class IV